MEKARCIDEIVQSLSENAVWNADEVESDGVIGLFNRMSLRAQRGNPGLLEPMTPGSRRYARDYDRHYPIALCR
jgi:hypothetical protein